MATFSEHKWGIGPFSKNYRSIFAQIYSNEKCIKIPKYTGILKVYLILKKMLQISESEFSEDWDFSHKLGENWLYLRNIERD